MVSPSGGEDPDDADPYEHQAGGNRAAFPRDGRHVAIADRGGGDHGPPERVLQGLDRPVRPRLRHESRQRSGTDRHQADRPDEEHPPSRHDPAAAPNADGRDCHRSQQAQQAERPERPCAFHGIGHEEGRRDDDDQQIQPLPLDPN
jgi:hypothetical protein